MRDPRRGTQRTLLEEVIKLEKTVDFSILTMLNLLSGYIREYPCFQETFTEVLRHQGATYSSNGSEKDKGDIKPKFTGFHIGCVYHKSGLEIQISKSTE